MMEFGSRDLLERATLQRRFANTASIAGGIAMTFAAIAYQHAPAVNDLYNTIYPPHHRPHKSESPLLFLFGFPAMLLVVAVTARFNWSGHRRGMPDVLVIPFMMLWLSIFFFGSLLRSWLVISFYR